MISGCLSISFTIASILSQVTFIFANFWVFSVFMSSIVVLSSLIVISEVCDCSSWSILTWSTFSWSCLDWFSILAIFWVSFLRSSWELVWSWAGGFYFSVISITFSLLSKFLFLSASYLIVCCWSFIFFLIYVFSFSRISFFAQFAFSFALVG